MRTRVLLGWSLAAALLLIALYGPSVRAHVERAWHPLVYNDDARQQIAPFHRYAGPDFLPDDLLSDYFLSLFPVGYHAMYFAAAKLWDPISMSHLLQYVLMVLAPVALTAAAARLAGPAAIPVAAVLAVGTSTLWRNAGGGLPHSFGYPLLAVGAALLVFGRIRLLAASAVLAAGFYPMVGALLGIALGLLLLLSPAADRGSAREWSFRSRMGFLAATALAMAALQVAPALASRSWGDLIGPDRFSEYPEAGRRGRYGAALARPWPELLVSVPLAAERSLETRGDPFVPSARSWLDQPQPTGAASRRSVVTAVLIGFSLLGWLGLAGRDTAARRLLVLPLALSLAHEAAIRLDPYFYLPVRYVGYVVPTLMWILLPAAAAGCVALLPGGAQRPKLRAVAVLAAGAVFLAVLGGGVQLRAGVSHDGRRFGPLLKAVGETPRDALIAGWPNGPIQEVTLIERRVAFITWESHQAFHAGFMDTMRVRMRALIDAYFAVTAEPVERLRDEHGVTHLIVEPSQLSDRAPTYFSPFHTDIRAARARAGGRSWLLEQIESGRGKQYGRYVLLPLADL